MDDITKMVIRAALAKMIRDGYMDICAINKILKITGGFPNQKDYDLLSALHCVHFSEMEPELRRGLPVIVERVINANGIEIHFGPEYKQILSGQIPALN